MRLTLIFCLFVFNLSLYGQIEEKTYLRTDKDLYAPGDTLWFKGYVFNRQNIVHDDGLKFNIFIANEAGLKLSDSSWPIYNGMCYGHIALPLAEGRYFLVAYTPDMINLEVENHFRKEIFVRSAVANDLQLDLAFDKKVYRPEQEVNVEIKASYNNEKTFANERFTYQYLLDGEPRKKGRFRTDEQGNASIKDLKAPDSKARVNLLIQKKQDGLPLPFQLNTPIEVRTQSIDLQFFPEGGKLVRGISTKVAFKALDRTGEPVDIKGLLLDEAGKEIESISSYYQGMGSFYLRPDAQEYRFKITEPAGIDSIYQLPAIAPEGSIISVQYSEEEPLIKVSNSERQQRAALEVRLIQHGKTVFSQSTKGIPIEFIRLPVEFLDIGVAKLSLVSGGEQIISERLIFHGSTDRLKVDISTDRAEYRTRDLVKVKLSITDRFDNPIQGNFSLAAVDDTYAPQLRPDAPNLMAQILLQSELKGTVPTPNFYFTDHEKAGPALDLVMLTHGWRNYELVTSVSYETITGELVNQRKRRNVLSQREISVFGLSNLDESLVTTDNEGRFSIPPVHFKYKGDSFLVAAKAEEKREKPMIRLSNEAKVAHRTYKSSVTDWLTETYQPDYSIYLKENQVQFDRFRNALILNSVSVFGEGMGGCELSPVMTKYPWRTKLRGELDLTDQNPLSLVRQVSGNIKGYGNLATWKDGVYTLILQDMLLSHVQKSITVSTNYGRTTRFYPMWYSVFVNCESVGEFGPSVNMSYGLGGLDLSNVSSISVLDPEPMDEPRPDRFGAIFIRTIDGKTVYRPFSRKFFTYALKTEQEAEFYTPMYDTQEKRNLEIPDLRSTIHWEHTIITDEFGEAEIQFYNGDRDNRIRITVEGLGSMQRFGFAQKDYRVLMPGQ